MFLREDDSFLLKLTFLDRLIKRVASTDTTININQAMFFLNW